ncbi:MAG: prepilin-type N-terminal cleavage/methylation domain-containing protein [candidate division WOR-3 bacterium]
MKVQKIKNHRKGLTLAEVLLVIFIITILVGIPFWSATGWIRRSRLKNEAIKVRTFIENQRTTAMGMSTRRALVFEGRNIKVLMENLTRPLPNLDSLVSVYTNFFSSNIYLGGIPGATGLRGGSIDSDGIMFGQSQQNNTLTFTAFGLVETPGEVYLNDGKNLFCIAINGFGQVKIYRWEGGQWNEIK